MTYYEWKDGDRYLCNSDNKCAYIVGIEGSLNYYLNPNFSKNIDKLYKVNLQKESKLTDDSYKCDPTTFNTEDITCADLENSSVEVEVDNKQPTFQP